MALLPLAVRAGRFRSTVTSRLARRLEPKKDRLPLRRLHETHVGGRHRVGGRVATLIQKLEVKALDCEDLYHIQLRMAIG